MNAKNVESAAKLHPNAKKYTDFRKVLDDSKDYDAVVVSTCEHTHAFATLPALQLGKHVYCEKPLTHGVWEARVVTEAAKKAKVATQMGTQAHANDSWRRVVELVQSGSIGKVTEVHVWVNRTWGGRAPRTRSPTTTSPARRTGRRRRWPFRAPGLGPLIGPAPMRPFHTVYFPGPKWYRWWDFGSGTMSDLGSHLNDIPFWALKLDAPKTIEGFGPPPHAEIAPPRSARSTSTARAATCPPAPSPGIRVRTRSRPTSRTAGCPAAKDGVLFVGDKGMVVGNHGKHSCSPPTRSKTSSGPRDDPQVHRPPQGVDRRREDRPEDDLPLQLLRPAHRGEPPRRRSPTGWARSSNGTREPEVQERAGGRPPPEARVPQRMGAQTMNTRSIPERAVKRRSAPPGSGSPAARSATARRSRRTRRSTSARSARGMRGADHLGQMAGQNHPSRCATSTRRTLPRAPRSCRTRRSTSTSARCWRRRSRSTAS